MLTLITLGTLAFVKVGAAMGVVGTLGAALLGTLGGGIFWTVFCSCFKWCAYVNLSAAYCSAIVFNMSTHCQAVSNVWSSSEMVGTLQCLECK